MSVRARVILDSISPAGYRLTTIEVTMHRFVLAELNTHRTLSRNSASSRAIPVTKMLALHTAEPVHWGKNQSGMQAREELSGWRLDAAKALWRGGLAMDRLIVKGLHRLGLHKQLANRRLELGNYHVVLITATEWDNFLNLRCHVDAQPEIRAAAVAIREARDRSRPIRRYFHLPFVDGYDLADLVDDNDYATLARISAGRCARVSYLTHDGRKDVKKDLELAARLETSGHMSPFEHQAEAGHGTGNFIGWQQFRKTIPGESVFVPQPK